VLLLVAVASPDLPGASGKAMAWRLVAYPLAAALVPVVWRLRGRRGLYAYDVDILFTLPFLIDTVGNALDLYDSMWWWDDVNHLVNWAILVAAFACMLVRLPLGRLNVVALAVGFGALTRSSGSTRSTSRSSARTRTSSRRPTRTRSATCCSG
jgi:hypothetical protein